MASDAGVLAFRTPNTQANLRVPDLSPAQQVALDRAMLAELGGHNKRAPGPNATGPELAEDSDDDKDAEMAAAGVL